MRATISRTELFAFIRTLGGNPYDTRRVEITPSGVEVTTFRRDERGHLVGVDGDAATDITTIAIVGSDGDQSKVRMRHPNLDREVDVPATAVGHHAVAGWEVVPDEPSTPQDAEQPDEAPEPPAEPEQTPQPEQDAPAPTTTPRARRTAKED